MLANNIVPQNSPARNGHHLKVRLAAAVKSKLFGTIIPEGTVGTVLESCQDGRLFVDFGYRSFVAILPPESPLIEIVELENRPVMDIMARLRECNVSQLAADFETLADNLARLESEIADLERRCAESSLRLVGVGQ